eukprot:TRINITY_DN3383_c0_g1_i2.p1 TRINITY_DN3383_c0_g1~~TRINITY_DN3383_c0_g1_i2.p1  ORF type:complete len:424 (+),score=131.75 TRINITY_DN3383_c0_g1_i2:140-1411(+)
MFIHGKHGNAIYELVQSLGLRRLLLDWSGEENGEDVAESMVGGRALSGRRMKQVDRFCDEIEEELGDDEDRVTRLGVTREQAARMPLSAYFDFLAARPELLPGASDLSTWMNVPWLVRYVGAAVIGTEYAAPLDDMSLLHYDDDEENRGGDHLIEPPSYDAVLRHLAEGSRIVLNNVVASVRVQQAREDETQAKVLVTGSAGEFLCNAVVCTVPLSVLKSDSISFSPPLSRNKRAAMEGLGIALLNKIVLEFDRPFWDTEVAYFENMNERSGLMFPAAVNLQWYLHSAPKRKKKLRDVPAVLLFFVGGESARELELLSDEEAVERCLHAVEDMFFGAGSRKNMPHVKQSLVTRWGQEAHSLGSYSYIRIGSDGGVYDAMAIPEADGRVRFAGEATFRQHPSTVHGAYLSGLREAAAVVDMLSK